MLVQSGCKINIGLWVTKRRTDGYHDVRSLFVPIPFFDTLEIVHAQTADLLTYNADFSIPKEKNLVWKCYLLMCERYAVPPLQIHLVKRIPSGGGIGGGSGNVGALINAVDAFCNLNLSIHEKENLAMEIGSDCGFFIENRLAIVSGRGEVMVPYSSNRKFYAVLLFSKIQISTKEAYEGMEPNARNFSFLSALKDSSDWQSLLTNDFRTKVYGMFPELASNEKALLQNGAFYASLSGTGGCQVGLFNEKHELTPELKSKMLWEGWLNI